jgi:hypothetical protein
VDAGSGVGRPLNLFAGQIVEPHAINGLFSGRAESINDAGQIVGVARQDAHPSRQVGFLLTPLG